MSRISDNLSVLVDAKGAIASAIEAKGGTVTGGLTDYASAIRAIPGGGAEIPEGTKFAYSTWTEIPAAVKSYVVGVSYCVQMFYNCFNLSEVNLELPNATNLSGCFWDCRCLREVNLELPNATDLSRCFYYCTNLVDVTLNTPNATDLSSCFEDCSSLTAISLDLPKASSLSSCFYGCSNLVDVTLNIPNATNLSTCFTRCFSLTTISLDVPNASSLLGCFSVCTRLKSISFTKLSKVNSVSNFIYDCSALEDFYAEEMSGQADWSFTPCSKLTHDSLMNIINALLPTTNKTCSLGTTNLAKLTDDEIAIATNKGWVLN